ncbi:MAG: ATPase with chaperone activity, ATP-binding subunit [Candidatus Magasanikbacteria bacterium GW2011_GWC2_37_14]|uniref:ATPase with chaperone activity, ATP-binding subunit n=1 Tax=Candidatus Magasanikbacteria bacterium GW2011_GWC2_37_14 TaxID=1619046 RepID=A0A0G0GBG9_9BACT|nr:MAG: ATPase with chaperone activity, ATP-binding subunit [Candidatus Magasanikbacteria bacterium GW2011_GWC2_37_14]
MLFDKAKPINILSCNVCKNTGVHGILRCPECAGMSMGVFLYHKFLYWGKPINLYHISLRRARRRLEYLRILGSFIFSFGLLILFFYNIYLLKWWDLLYTFDFWFNGPVLATLFWLALIGFCYLFYRLIVLGKAPEIVDIVSYKDANKNTLETEENNLLQNWTSATKMPRYKRKDISATFTEENLSVLEEAYFLAKKSGAAEITSFHIFYSLLSSSRVSTVFLRLGVPIKLLQAQLANYFVKSTDKQLPKVGNDLEQILFRAYQLARNARQEYVHVTELLLAVVLDSQVIQEMLYDFKIDKDKLANVTEWLRIHERLRRQYYKFQKAAAHRSKHGLDRAMTAVATPYLNSFSQDLTMAAKYGYLAPCVGRDEEIKEIFRIIEGGRQSVALVGERGVGKMSIIEGIAQKMIEDDVPDRLKDKRLVQLSTANLLAGTTASGAEERLIRIMHEVGRAKNIILFIKNIDDLVGVSDSVDGGVDVSQTLAEYLGPGKFLTFSTATTANYNKRVLNTELGTVLSRVDIKEMNDNQSVQVLESKVGHVEYKNNVFFSYEALASCVKMAKTYLHEQNLPESALLIMSEAASLVRSERGENQLVDGEAVAEVISKKTGVPITSLTENESEKLLRLEQKMHERVIGQDEAVKLIANALRRARVDIRSQKRPIANFLFLGPTGVGKTELAKTIAEVYFGGEDKMVRIDMSEFQDKSSIYRLLGQPGQQGSGLLTEAVRQHPFSLVLLDEMEKADPDVLNLFLQVFDDGRLTDSTGRVIDFTNTIIIATSNAGTGFVQEQFSQGVSLESIRQQLVKHELKQYYRPEFLNRFDGIILFKTLTRYEIMQVAKIMLLQVGKDLEKRGVELKIADSALEALANVGYDPEFGARPMRRAIQDTVENSLAELILENKLARRDVVTIGGDLKVLVEKAK